MDIIPLTHKKGNGKWGKHRKRKSKIEMRIEEEKIAEKEEKNKTKYICYIPIALHWYKKEKINRSK